MTARYYLSTFLLFFSLTWLPSPLLAVDNPQTSGAPVSATVPVTGTSDPILLTPKDNSYTKNPFEQFSWQEATASGGINHYTFYLDGLINIGFLPTNTLSQNTALYSYSRSDDKAYLTLKDPLTEGSHTWYILAYPNSSDTLQSSTFTFTIDTTLPIIILERLEKHTMYWASNDPNTFPPFSERQLTVNTNKPLLEGKVEANANLKIAFLCPINASDCSDISYTLSDPDGNWVHRVRNLKESIPYTVYLIATDYASNTTYFPVFTVTYKPKKILPPLPYIPGITKPTPTPSPSPIIEPPQAPSKPPAIPSAPLPPLAPSPAPTPTPATPLLIPAYLLYLIVFGLIIHLALTIYAKGIKLWLIPKFLIRLLLPFTTSPRYQTVSLSTILLYNAKDQKHIEHLKTIIATVTGHFHLSKTLPPTVYLKIHHPLYQTGQFLYNAKDLPQSLPLSRKNSSSFKDLTHRLANYIRPIPLLIALATSIYAYLSFNKLFLLIYFSLSLYLAFIQYLPVLFSSEPESRQ